MSNSPFSDADDQSREERLFARLNGLIQYQSDLLDKVRRGQFRPYCHIPDLFDLDPEATRPYSVPSSFIPEQVGGTVSVTDANGGFLAHEPLDLILSSYLPGGYKRRWEFDIWTGNFEPSSRPGFADIEEGIRVRTSEPLETVLPESQHERYTPYRHDTDNVEIYIPNEFIVWGPSVDERGSVAHYYWDEVNRVVRNRKPDEISEEDLRELKSDPTSQFLWFKHLLDEGDGRATIRLDDLSNGLFRSATFSDDATFLKAYYATLLTLYGEDTTFSEVVRYRHDGDDETAFVASRERSQVVLFESDRDTLQKHIEHVIVQETPLYRDLQFSLLYKLLWDRLFFQKDALDHAFSVDPFFNSLVALDYSLAASSEEFDSFFEADLATLRQILPSLLPDSESRLALLDYDEKQLMEYGDVLEEHWDTVQSILEECSDRQRMTEFAEHVFVHSLKHGLASWAAEYSAGGNEFEAWYDINFQERDADRVRIGIYDSIQGGAGISKEIFEDIDSIDDQTLLKGVGSQGCCHISATEEVVNRVLRDNSGEHVFDLVQTASASRPNPELATTFDELGSDYRRVDYEDVQSLVQRQLESITETQELTRFYAAVTDEYASLREELMRTPRPVDVVFGLEDRTFFDSRVRQTYERFANRKSRRRDLSELAERVEEITKQCVHACPDCLKRQSCTHQYRYQEEMLDRRLLTRVVASLEEGET